MKILESSLGILMLAFVGGCSSNSVMDSPQIAQDELYRDDTPDVILKAARTLMESDENVALVSVDGRGQPRVRTVRAFLSEPNPSDRTKEMTVWVMTRDSTRKVEQLRQHPQATLYFNDDAKLSYLTIMGKAVVHTDPASEKVQPFLAMEGYKEFFWPDFPKGFVMIEIQPSWIEFMGPGVKNHRQHWRPLAVSFPIE